MESHPVTSVVTLNVISNLNKVSFQLKTNCPFVEVKMFEQVGSQVDKVEQVNIVGEGSPHLVGVSKW